MSWPLFEKKRLIYKKKDRESWKKILKALKEEKIRHIHAGHYYNDVVGIDGISGMVDPRDFAVGHFLDRHIYFIEVRESDEERAREAALRHGLVLEVENEYH